MSTHLKKITAKAKQIRRKQPNKYKGKKRPWQAYVKEAADKLRKPARKRPAKKSAATKRKAPRKKPAVKKSASRKPVRASAKRTPARRKVVMTKSVTMTVGNRKVGARGVATNTILVAGLGLAALWMFTRQSKAPASTPPLVTTTNPVRDQKAQDIVSWAVAGGLAIDAIIKLINSLNTKPEGDIDDIYDSINSGEGIPPYLIA